MSDANNVMARAAICQGIVDDCIRGHFSVNVLVEHLRVTGVAPDELRALVDQVRLQLSFTGVTPVDDPEPGQEAGNDADNSDVQMGDPQGQVTPGTAPEPQGGPLPQLPSVANAATCALPKARSLLSWMVSVTFHLLLLLSSILWLNLPGPFHLRFSPEPLILPSSQMLQGVPTSMKPSGYGTSILPKRLLKLSSNLCRALMG
jgi:hypothetical protein